MERQRLKRCIEVGLAAFLLPVILPALLPATAAAERGRCTSAEIEEPIVLPDGTEHPNGTLKLCVSQHLTPVMALHTTYVNGRSVGLLPSHRGVGEGNEEQAFMMFFRDRDGRLHLYGYAVPRGERLVTYRLANESDDTHNSTGSRAALSRDGAAAAMLLAARAN